MGGMLADPITTLPNQFGRQGPLFLSWLETYPYALPSLLNALFLTITTIMVFLGLEEV
jgi:hypothetical protein